MKRLTIRDVAEQAGVSVGTVSNALNRPNLVAEETRERILEAVEELGFVRNAAARQLRGVRSAAIGLVVLDVGNPFFAEVARGVEDAATANGHLVILCSSAGDRTREDRQLRLLEEQRVAGVLMTPATPSVSRLHQVVRKRGTPIVLLDRRSARRDQCSVAVDDVAGGRLAAHHLIELGHRQLALINGSHEMTQCVERRRGFVTALEESGLSLTATNEVEMDAMTIAAGEEAARKLLSRRRPPTAIFCTNDLLALGAQHAVITSGRSIPHDVAIVGYDDVAFASMAFTPLTTIRQPAYDLGYRSAELVLEEATDPQHRHQRLVFSPELVVRASTVAGTVS
jgi:LacI family transcriptional regulator